MLAMPDVGQDTKRRIGSFCEVPPGAAELRQLEPGVAVGILIHCRCVVDGVEATG